MCYNRAVTIYRGTIYGIAIPKRVLASVLSYGMFAVAWVRWRARFRREREVKSRTDETEGSPSCTGLHTLTRERYKRENPSICRTWSSCYEEERWKYSPAIDGVDISDDLVLQKPNQSTQKYGGMQRYCYCGVIDLEAPHWLSFGCPAGEWRFFFVLWSNLATNVQRCGASRCSRYGRLRQTALSGPPKRH